MKLSIREFLDSIILDSTPKTIDWNGLLADQEYYPVEFDTLKLNQNYVEIHKWCREAVGDPHYVWTGTKIWFETEQAALLFSMRWS